VQHLDTLLGAFLPNSVKDKIRRFMEMGYSGGTSSSKLLSTVTLTKVIPLFQDDKYDVYTKGYPASLPGVPGDEDDAFVQAPERFGSMRSVGSIGSMHFYDATSQNGSFMSVGEVCSLLQELCRLTLYHLSW
jgi:hypothetical protein